MISRIYYVSCDGCGMPQRAEHDTIREARTDALRHGWHRVPKRSGSHPNGSFRGADYCPRCFARKATP